MKIKAKKMQLLMDQINKASWEKFGLGQILTFFRFDKKKKNGEGRVNEWINRAKFIENCSSEHRENFSSVCWSCYSIRKLEAEAVLLEQAVFALWISIQSFSTNHIQLYWILFKCIMFSLSFKINSVSFINAYTLF